MALTRDQILSARRGRKPTALEVPEWGGTVYIRVLSAEDQLAIADSDGGVTPVKVLVACLVDENGERLFSGEDATELGKEDFPVILRVFAEVARLNGLSSKELDEAMESFGIARGESSSTE